MRRDSYLKIGAQLIAVCGAMAAIAVFGLMAPGPKPRPPVVVAPTPAPPAPKPRSKPVTAPQPAPSPPEIVLDRDAIAKAEADLQSAANDGDRAQAREKEAAERLKSAQARAASAAIVHRSLASTVRDPTPRTRAAKSKGEALALERDKLRGELQAFSEAPRPRRKVLIDKSPVAKKTEGEEFHFEIRADRVAFIDLERLLDKVKTDARVQVRLSNGLRPAAGTVGPVGAFEMQYEVARLDNGSNPLKGSFGLSSWEIVPSRGTRGETFEAAMGPASDFARAIRRLNPSHDVVTLWVYPDGFALYRRLRETLHSQGFLVAARPLPEGMTIRGSPSGSASSAQ